MDKPFAEVEAGLEKSGRVEELIKLYDSRSREVPPPEGAPLLNKAAELARDRIKAHDRAEEFFRRSLLLRSDQREALLGLKVLFEQKQDQAQLAETLERLGAQSQGPESATFFLRAAEIYEQKVGRRDRAIFCCQQACRMNPQDRASFRRVRALFMTEHKHLSAFDALQHERATFGDEGMAEEFVAFAERLIDDPTQHELVQRALGLAAEIEPSSPRVDKAQKALEKFEHTWRDRVRMLRGQSLEERDRKSAARLSLLVAKLFAWYDPQSAAKVKEALDRCFLLWPAMPDALTLIEKIAERAGFGFDATVTTFERMAIDAKDRTAQVDLWIRTGTLKLTKLDDKGGALDAFEKAVAIDPSRADASGLAAELLLEMGEAKEAIAILEKHLGTLKDRAAQVALRLRLADLCAALVRNVPAARVHLEAVLNLDGTNATAAYELARLYVEESDAESLEPLVDLAAWAPRPVKDRVALCEAAGMLFEETQHPKLAFQVLARGLYLDPSRVDVLGSMLENGRKANAVPELTRALQLAAGVAPPEAAAALWRSVAALAETPAARKQAWEEVVKRAPDDRAAADALAEAVAELPAPLPPEPKTDPGSPAAPSALPRITPPTPGDEARAPNLGPTMDLKSVPMARSPVPQADKVKTEIGVPVFRGEDAKAKLEAEARRLEGSAADPASAAAIYRQILEIAPDDISALKRLGAASAALAQWEEVARVAARLGDITETLSERQEWRGRLAQLYAERLSRKDEAVEVYLSLLAEGAANAAVVGGLERLASAGVRQTEISRALAPHYAKSGDYQRQVASLLVQLTSAQEMEQKKELLSLLAQTHERHLADVRAAFEFRVRGLQVDPADADFLAEAVRLARELSSHTELSRVLSDLGQKSADAHLSSSLLVEAATLAEEGGSVDDAAAALKLALDKAPDDPEVLAQLIQLYFKSGRFADCDQVLRRRILLAEGEEKANLYLTLADVSQELHRPREAAQALQEAIKAGAAEEPLLERLTDLLEQGGRISELAAALQKQIELATRSGDQDKVSRLSLKRAQVLEAQLGDKSEALKNYSAILEQRPSDPDALAALEHLLGDPSCAEEAAKALIPAYEAVKEHRKLIHALEQVATVSQDDLEKVLALKKAAYVHLHLLRQPELAFAALARAMRLAPGDAQVRNAARQAAEDADQLDAFAEVAVEALQGLKDTARVPLHRELAEVYEKKLAKRELAVEQLRAALELDGKNLDVLKGLQRLHRAADDWASLADVLLKLAAVVPEPSEKVHLWREAAFLYEDKLADQDAAAAAWRQISERDPLDRESAAALDQLYTALDRPQELAFALELRRAQEGQSPQGRELAYRLAQVRQNKLADSAGALQLYRQIVTEDPGHKGARAALEGWVVNKGPVSAAALEILDPVLVQLSDHQKRVQLREARMDGALPQEKARLAAEICAIYERDLGQAELAFMAALRAFSSGIDQQGLQPELERLAKTTGSFEELAEVYENAAANMAPTDEQALWLQARAAELREQLGQPDEAVRLWRLVLEGSPQDRRALDSLGRLFEQSQNARSLSEVYARKATLAADPTERLDLLLKAGAAFEAAGDDEKAIEHFRTALALRKTPDGLASLDRLYGKAHRTEEQADVLDQLAQLAGEPDEQRGYLSRRALLLEKEGGPGEALAAFTRVLELAPNDPTAVAGLERMLANEAVKLEVARVLEPVYRSVQDTRKLVEILDLRLGNAVGERRLELLDEIARLREALGEKAQAFAARMQAFSEAPGSPELFAELDRLAAETGSFEDLAALYEEHLKSGAAESLQLELWRRVAAIYGERLNRLDLAARAWTEVARKDQADMRALENLAAIYRKTKAFKELAQIMKRQVGLEKNVATQIQLLFELARLAEEMLSDKTLAAQCYQAIMARKPDDQNAIKFLGRVLAETERWPELAALLQKEIALCEQKGQAEESCELMVRLGRLKLSRLGDPRGALDLYQAVLQKRPSHPGAVGALEEMAKSDSPLRGEAASILEPIFAGGGDYLKTVQMLESRFSAASTPAQRADLQRRIAGLYAEQMSNPSMAFLAATKALQELPDDEASLKMCLDLASAAEATDELDALLEEVAERATEEKARLHIRRALAQLRTSSGDEDRAIESWKRVLELDPSHPEALERLSELLSKVGNGPELAEVLRRKLALTEDPEERAQLMFEIGDLQYGALKDAHGALATFRLVLEQKADSVPVLERMEQLSAELERWPELADVISRRIALHVARLEQQGHPDPQSHQEVLDLKFRLAQVRELKLLDKHGALQMYTEILGAAPKHAGALQRLEAIFQREAGNASVLDVLLHAYRQGGDAQKLAQALEARVNLAADPYDRKPLLRELADLRLQQQEPEMAFLALFRGFKDDPNDAELRAELEKVADSAGTHDELASAYEEELPRIAEAKDAALVCLKLGTLYEHRLKEAERAVGVYERARTFDPEIGLKALPALDRLYAQLEAWQELGQVLELEVAAAEQPADKVKLLFRLGQLHQDRLQNQESAAGAYERILQIDKAHLASARLLEQIYESQGQVDKLYVVLKLQRDAVQGPERDRILSRMAQVSAEGLSDIDHSIEIYQELLAKNPRNDQAFGALEGLLEKAGKHEELFELLKKKLSSVLDPRELVRLNEKVGRVLFRMAGKAEEAIPYFKAALDRDARNKNALESMREIYDQLGRKDELVVVLRRLLPLQEQAEGVKAVRLRLAEVLAEMGRREEALDAARRALEVEPHQTAEMDRVHAIFSGLRAWADAARALELKADLHAQVEERDQAVATLFAVADLWRSAANKPENAGPPLEKILELDPANRSAYEQAIDLHAKHNDWRAYAQAVDRYLPHLVTDEEKVEALKDLARVQEQRLGQNDLAFMAACRALQLNPADDGIREEVERLAEQTGSHDEIAAVYEELADELPRGPLAERIYLKLAQIQDEKLDDAGEAEASLRKILDFDPTNQVALDRLAQMFARRGADTEYVVALEQKLETAGSIEERKAILREIARVYDERQQNPEEAAAALLRALELEPDEETLRVLTELYRRQQRWPDVANALLRARDLASTPEQRGQLQVQVAELYEREMGDDEAAIAAYAQALELDPAQRGALDALERLYTKLDRPGDLLQTYNAQLELTAEVRERVKIFFKSASIWEDKYQNLEHADTCIQNILEIDAANLQAITMLERLRRAQERWEDLVAVFDRHLQISETTEEQAQILVEAGEVFYQQLRHVDRAAQSYTRALEVEPTNRAAMHALGLLYERSGNWPFALEMLTREAEAFGGAGEAVELYYRMGKINEEMLLDMDSAKSSYERALQIDPGYLPAIRSLKGIYESTKDWSAYEQALVQEAEKTEDPEAKAKAYLEVARHTEETKEDKEGAAPYYEEALRLEPELLEAARPLADIYIAREEWEKGERMLDIVVKEMPVRVSGKPDEHSLSKELCRQYYRLGYVVEKLAKKEKALACYEKAYQLDATYLPALEGLGNMLVQARRLEEALKVYQSILIHHRDDLTDLEVVEVYWQIGDIHYGLKQYDRAQNHFEKAMAIDPHHEPTLRALVQLADGAGKWDKAAEYRSQLVQVLDGEQKFAMYVELGMLAREKLADPYMAIDAYGWAHKLSPEALDVMDALYQLYRETKQGAKAAEIVEKLLASSQMKEKPEKAKRIFYALGEIARDELKDLDRAVGAFNAALDADVRFLEAFSAIEALLGSNKQWKKLEENYARMIQRLPKTEDTHAARMTLWRALGDLYLRVLKQPQDALMAYKVVAAGLPLDAPVQETYAELASQVPGNEDEAIGAYRRALLQSQNQGKVCSALAELAARKRDYDTAYLAAQVAQSLIGQAGDAEKEILTKLQPYAKRKEVAQRPLSEQQWQGQLFHPSVRGPLGQLLALIFNQAGHLWAVQLAQYQINPKRHRIDVGSAPEYQIHHFRYVAKLLGMEHVELYSPFLIATRERMAKRSNEPAPDPTVAVEICHSHPMTLRVGGRFFGEAGQKEVYYLLGRTMALMRPELALATRLSPERLEAVLQAAITLVVPNFRLTAHPQAVGDERRNLEKALTEPLRAQLGRMVQQYMKVAGAADLKNYLEGVELTGVRTGLFVAGEVEPAKKMVLNETGGASRLTSKSKLRDLAVFALSDELHALRAAVGTNVEVQVQARR